MILVTGITGHSGRYFLQELIDNKYPHPIRCIVRETSDSSFLMNCGLQVERLVGSLDDQEFVDEAMVGIGTVVHIASIFYSVAVMRAAVKCGVKRAIFVHTTGVYSKYKSAAEEYKNIEINVNEIREKSNSSIGLIYLRPTMIYGNVNDKNMIVFIKMVDKLRIFPVIAGGETFLQPVNGRDLGKAYFQVLNKPDVMSGDYILSGERPISMIDMFRLIANNLARKTVFVSIPLGLGVFMARLLKIFTVGKVDLIEKVQRMGENRHFSHEAAAKDFGYRAMSFEEGLQLEIEQYVEKCKR